MPEISILMYVSCRAFLAELEARANVPEAGEACPGCRQSRDPASYAEAAAVWRTLESASYFLAQNYQVLAYSGARKQKNTAGDGRRGVVKGKA